MNEIEKMYDNCGLLKLHGWSCKLDRIKEGKICELEKEVLHCKNCKYSKQEYYHRPFTTEEQIKLLKFLSKLDLYGEVILRDSFDEYLVKVEILDPGFTLVEAYRNTLEEAIAAVVNKRWEYLTEKQKQEVKEILSE